MRRALLPAVAAVLLLAGPAAAENPVLDAEGDADVAAALAEAQEVQDVCYGYVLLVSDGDTGQFSGTFASSSAGPGIPASTAPGCSRGAVEVQASITYTSSFSEAEDSASWQVLSTIGGGLTIDDVERVTGAGASDLLDDGRSETVLLDAVLSLPGLASELAGLPPVVLEPNASPLPDDARATDTPGSDWLRQNGAVLGLCVVAIVAGVVLLLLSRRTPRPAGSERGSAPPRLFGPPRTGATDPRDPYRPTDPRSTL
ncbi:MAG: hypothetical protein JWN08_128 [Frankiales bacterium]|nr:hypothetical protein [Frankiales bacterium]